MANPAKQDCLVADASGDGMLADRQALLADVALTGVDTGTDMTAAQAAALVTAINGILDILEAHGLMSDT